MTGLEMLIAKEIATFAAKAIFDMVQSEDNSLTADQAKEHAKSALSELSEQAQKPLFTTYQSTSSCNLDQKK